MSACIQACIQALVIFLQDSSYIVRNMYDVNNIPVNIDYDALLYTHRNAFESSNVHIHSFLNVIYLVYKFIPTAAAASAARRR